MNPTLIDNMSWAMAEVYGACSDRLMVNMARHFKYIHTDKDAEQLFKYQARLLAQLGQIDKESADIIYMYMGGADASLRQALETAIVDAIKPVEKPLRDAAKQGLLNGAPTTPRPLSANMTQAFKSYYRQSADKLNIVNTVMLESTKAAYQATVADVVSRLNRSQEILNIGAGEVVTGVSTWNEAMHDAVRDMARNGLTGFVDHAGRRWSPEAYAAMDIRSTMFNTARAAVWERAEEYGADIYQVSSHNGARPLCYPWQGKLISRSGWTGDVEDIDGNVAHVYAESETSKGEPAGLFGINCRHYPMPFIPKFSALRYKGQDEEDNERTYAESQEQRGLERKLRGERLELELLKAQGASPDAIQAQELRVDKASDDIDRFCDETGRARRRSREYTPINADWPDKTTYDAADFPTAVRDEINDFFRNNDDNNPSPPRAPIHIGPDDMPPAGQAQTPAQAPVEDQAQEPVNVSPDNVPLSGATQNAAKKAPSTEYTADEKNAVEYYVSGDGMWVNKYLRDQRGYTQEYGPLSEDDKQLIRDLDSATEKQEVKDKSLYRAVDAQAVFGKMSDLEFENLRGAIIYGDNSKQAQAAYSKAQSKIGQTITENGYMSTTHDKEIAYQWQGFTGSSKDIALELTVENGIKGFDVEKFFEVDEQQQREVLLQRGLSYTVRDIVKREDEEGGAVITVIADLHKKKK